MSRFVTFATLLAAGLLASCGETVIRDIPPSLARVDANVKSIEQNPETGEAATQQKSGTKTEVNPEEPPAGMSVHCDFVGLIGELAECSAVAEFASGPALDVSERVTWSSENEEVLALQEFSLTRGALFHLRKPGSAKIKALLSGVSADRLIEVKDYGFQTLRLTPETANRPLGLPLRMKATALYKDREDNFYALDVTKNIGWSVSDETIATFDQEELARGVLRSKTAGKIKADAYFAVEEGHTRTANVEFTPAFLTSLKFETGAQTETKVYVGTLNQLRVTGVYNDGSEYDATEWAKWEVLEPEFAELDSPGVINALKTAAKVNVRAAFGGHVATHTLQIVESDIESLTMTPDVNTLFVGQDTPFTVTANWKTGETQNVTNAVQWSTSDGGVLWVQKTGQDKGRVLPIKKGNATLTATFGSKSTSLDIAVSSEAIKELAFLPESLELAVGDEAAAQVLGVIDDGTSVLLPQTFTWEATPPGIIRLQASGNSMLIIALQPGIVELFLADDKRAKRTLQVTIKAQGSVTPTPTTTPMPTSSPSPAPTGSPSP